jgi:hypothetical protein
VALTVLVYQRTRSLWRGDAASLLPMLAGGCCSAGWPMWRSAPS